MLEAEFFEDATPVDSQVDSQEVHSLAMATLEHVEAEAAEPVAVPESFVEPVAPASSVDLADAWRGPVVVMDDDLLALEWVKEALNEDLSPIHIFQRSEQGLSRIRQYLVRGEAPLVLIAADVRVDTLSGIRNAEDFVARLKAQSRRVMVLWLRKEGDDPGRSLGRADGVVSRPERNQLRLPDGSDSPEPGVERFRQKLLAAIQQVGASAALPTATATATEEVPPIVMGRLRDATRALTEASSRGDVLPLVIRFAAELFNRVAMFMVRDGEAVGIAQHGLETCGGPSDEALRNVRVDTRSSHWMSSVLDARKPICGAAEVEGDQKLSSLLGNRIPEVGYMAPIESGGQVIALVYGDNLVTGTPIGDTSALEVVLHHAGLALDRAALERALSESADADAQGSPDSR